MFGRRRDQRELIRFYQQELQRRDEMIQSLLDRIQHPDRTPIWREPPPPLTENNDDVSLVYADEFEGTTIT